VGKGRDRIPCYDLEVLKMVQRRLELNHLQLAITSKLKDSKGSECSRVRNRIRRSQNGGTNKSGLEEDGEIESQVASVYSTRPCTVNP